MSMQDEDFTPNLKDGSLVELKTFDANWVYVGNAMARLDGADDPETLVFSAFVLAVSEMDLVYPAMDKGASALVHFCRTQGSECLGLGQFENLVHIDSYLTVVAADADRLPWLTDQQRGFIGESLAPEGKGPCGGVGRRGLGRGPPGAVGQAGARRGRGGMPRGGRAADRPPSGERAGSREGRDPVRDAGDGGRGPEDVLIDAAALGVNVPRAWRSPPPPGAARSQDGRAVSDQLRDLRRLTALPARAVPAGPAGEFARRTALRGRRRSPAVPGRRGRPAPQAASGSRSRGPPTPPLREGAPRAADRVCSRALAAKKVHVPRNGWTSWRQASFAEPPSWRRRLSRIARAPRALSRSFPRSWLGSRLPSVFSGLVSAQVSVV